MVSPADVPRSTSAPSVPVVCVPVPLFPLGTLGMAISVTQAMRREPARAGFRSFGDIRNFLWMARWTLVQRLQSLASASAGNGGRVRYWVQSKIASAVPFSSRAPLDLVVEVIQNRAGASKNPKGDRRPRQAPERSAARGREWMTAPILKHAVDPIG